MKIILLIGINFFMCCGIVAQKGLLFDSTSVAQLMLNGDRVFWKFYNQPQKKGLQTADTSGIDITLLKERVLNDTLRIEFYGFSYQQQFKLRIEVWAKVFCRSELIYYDLIYNSKGCEVSENLISILTEDAKLLKWSSDEFSMYDLTRYDSLQFPEIIEEVDEFILLENLCTIDWNGRKRILKVSCGNFSSSQLYVINSILFKKDLGGIIKVKKINRRKIVVCGFFGKEIFSRHKEKN